MIQYSTPYIPGLSPSHYATMAILVDQIQRKGSRNRLRRRYYDYKQGLKDLGIALLNRFVADASRYGQPDSPPKMLGDRDLNVMLSPLPRNKRARDPRLEPNAPASPAPTAPSTPLSSPPPPAPEPPSAP